MDGPAVAVRDADLAVAWMDARNGTRDVWWAAGARGRFKPEARLHTAQAGDQGRPALAATGRGFLAAWADGGAIHLRLEDGTEREVSTGRGADGARLAVAGDAAWVVWQAGDGARARVAVRRVR